MSRTIFPIYVKDISELARSLRERVQDNDHPGHVELLNLIVRTQGYRNFQHFRAQQAAQDRLHIPLAIQPAAIDYVLVRRLLRFFDPQGRLIRWPNKRSQQHLCLWPIWSRVPARQIISGQDFDVLLKSLHLFGDHPLIRRWLCDYGMMSRTPDGREYRRVEQTPSPVALELIRLTKVTSA